MGLFFTHILNELYYGETNDIKKLQDLISELRKQASSIKITKINTLSVLKDINRHIENMFGFKAFSLYINPSKEYNALTLPISNKIDVWNERSKLKYDKNSLKYENNDYVVITYINSGLLLDKRFTDREIMAILLHEIGHSFTSGYRNNALISSSLKVLNVVSSIEEVIKSILKGDPDFSAPLFLSNNFTKLSDKIEKNIRKNKTVSNLLDTITYAGNIISTSFTEISIFLSKLSIFDPKSLLFNIINRLLSITPFNISKSFIGFRNEQLSDNFATMYGYGPDLTSGLTKIEKYGGGYKMEEFFNKIPFIQQMYQFVSLPISFIFNPLTSHPETVNRIKNQIDMLKNEINKSDLDSKVRKEIENDLKEIEKVLDRYLKIALDPTTDPHYYNKIYSKFMLDKFGGDMREKMFKTKSYEILDKK